jgi:hypothetical protein
MSKNKCPCCGITIGDNQKPIKTVKAKDVGPDSYVLKMPKGDSQVIWDRFARAGNWRKIE